MDNIENQVAKPAAYHQILVAVKNGGKKTVEAIAPYAGAAGGATGAMRLFVIAAASLPILAEVPAIVVVGGAAAIGYGCAIGIRHATQKLMA